MRASKRNKLSRRGWKVGNADEFLGLTPEEAAYVGLRLKLAQGLRTRRARRGVTQAQLAGVLQSSQSRVAKIEAGDPTVSIDLMIRSLLALGASNRDLARMITSAES